MIYDVLLYFKAKSITRIIHTNEERHQRRNVELAVVSIKNHQIKTIGKCHLLPSQTQEGILSDHFKTPRGEGGGVD